MTATGVLEAEIPLDRAELTIGRDQACDVVVGESLVSRRHAKVVRTAQGGHLLLDDGSNIGVMMGQTKVSHRELREGDVFQIGLTRFQYTAAEPQVVLRPTRRGRGWAIVAAGLVLVVVVGGVAMFLGLEPRPAEERPTAPVTTMTPIGGGAFQRTARALAAQVAAMNRAEQVVVAPGGDVDAELAALALAALDAGRTARALADTVAVQPRSETTSRAYRHHQGVARAAYAQALAAATKDTAAVTKLAGRASNPAVVSAGTTVEVAAPDDAAVWISTTAATDDVAVPVALDALTAPAREAVGALAALGADVDQERVVVALYAGISITDLAEQAVDKVKTFVPGEVTQVVAGEVGAVVVQDFLDGVSPKTIDPDARAKLEASPPPSVAVVIGRVNRPADAPGTVQIDVSWTAPGPGELTILCQLPGYGSVEVPASGSGQTRVEIALTGAPSATVNIYCAAKDGRGITVGWKEVELEPRHDPRVDAAATAPALDASPPDAAPKPIDARPLDAAVGDAWIEPYCAAFEASLVEQRPDDAVAIAIVIDELRECLNAAVANGANEADAKASCARALKGEPEAPPAAKGWSGSYTGKISARVTIKGKTQTIGNVQTLTIVERGGVVVITNLQGEEVKLTLAADGKTGTGTYAQEHVSGSFTFALENDTLTMDGRFTDDEGGGGTMTGTLTRK